MEIQIYTRKNRGEASIAERERIVFPTGNERRACVWILRFRERQSGKASGREHRN